MYQWLVQMRSPVLCENDVGAFFPFCVSLCHTVLSVPCSLVVTCFRKGWPLGSRLMIISCAFVTLPYGVLGQVWYLMYRFLIYAFFFTLKWKFLGRDSFEDPFCYLCFVFVCHTVLSVLPLHPSKVTRHPQDNFSWVPNYSLGPPKCETKVS